MQQGLLPRADFEARNARKAEVDPDEALLAAATGAGWPVLRLKR